MLGDEEEDVCWIRLDAAPIACVAEGKKEGVIREDEGDITNDDVEDGTFELLLLNAVGVIWVGW